MNWKQIEQKLVAAILGGDVEQIGKIADVLRFRGRLNYRESFELANHLTGVSDSQWDALLYEADSIPEL
jgi:hypothetical protein